MKISPASCELPADISREYPFQGYFLEMDMESSAGPVRMHFLDEGPRTGPVVLMLHGNPTWSFYYRKVVQLLSAEGYRCIVPDHIGCGLSDKPQDGYPYVLERRIEDVEQLLRALGVERFHLIVHDWGGAIGSGVAGRHPEKVERIVVLNTAAFRSLRIPFRIALCKIPFLGPFMVRAFNAFAGPAATMSVQRPLPAPVSKGFLWPYRSWKDRIAVARFVQDIPLHSAHVSYPTLVAVEEGLAHLKTKPMMIAWGAKDFCFTPAFLDQWKSFFPDAQIEYLETCGHYVLEDGGPELHGKICGFLRDTPGA